jgi:hypothetical protein
MSVVMSTSKVLMGRRNVIFWACRKSQSSKNIQKEKKRIGLISYFVLLTELLGKGSAHDLATNAGGSRKVSLAALAARRANVC